MANFGYMELAKMASSVFVSMIPLDISECAITSFDHLNYIQSDFTRNSTRLQQSIQSLKPNGGTNYNAALQTPVTGAFDLANKGIHKKVVIFLTDGNGAANEDEILAKAKDIEVYCISVGMEAPDVLKKLSNQTGGAYYENITTKEQAVQIFSAILFKTQNMQPSRIIWESAPECISLKEVLFKSTTLNLKYHNSFYYTPAKGLYYLKTDPKKISFSNSILNKVSYADISLTAINHSITINSFKSNHPLYKVETKFPLIINANSTATLKVSYNCNEVKPSEATIELLTDACFPSTIYLNTGNNQFIENNNIKLIQPNGNEIFYVGTDTIIQWTGVPKGDKVQLELSRDNGLHWELIASNLTQDFFHWKVAGDVTEKALIKVSIQTNPNATTSKYNFSPGNIQSIYKASHPGWSPYKFNPNEKFVISKSLSEYTLQSIENGRKINSITSVSGNRYVMFSNDGTKIYVYENEKPLGIYNSTTFEKIEDGPIISSLVINTYGNFLTNTEMTEYVCSNINKVTIHDFNTGKIVNYLTIATGQKVCDYKNGRIAVFYKGGAEVYDVVTGKSIFIAKDVQSDVNYAFLSSDGRYLATRSWDYNGKNIIITVYDLSTKTKLYSFINPQDSFVSLSIFDNYMLCPNNNKAVIVNIATGDVLYTSTYSGRHGWFSQDGKHIQFVNYGAETTHYCRSGLTLKGATNNIGKDSSDAVFKIIKPTTDSKLISFDQIYINNQKTISNIALIENKNGIHITINKIEISGKDASYFQIVKSNTSSIQAWKSGCNSEIAFLPNSVRTYEANIIISTNIGVFTTKLTGEGINNSNYVNTQPINMGIISVGASKDSTIHSSIKNLSNTALVMEYCRLSSNSSSSFKLMYDGQNTIPSLQSKAVKIQFKPTLSGLQLAYIEVLFKGQPSPIYIPVIGYGKEGQNRKITIVTKNKNTLNPIIANVKVADYANNLSQVIETGKEKGYYSYLSLSDRKYKVSGSAKNYVMDSILFSTSSLNDTITLLLTPIENKYITLSGTLINKNTQTPISGTVSLTDAKNIELKNIITSDNGHFEFEIHKDSIYKIRGEAIKFIHDEQTITPSINADNLSQNLLLEPIQIGKTIQLNKVYFERSKAVLLEESYVELDKLASLMLQYPNMKIYLSGHTDNQGDPAKNVQLSNERVNVIKEYLISKGIDSKRIAGKGFGGSQPIASNDTEDTRKLNRRVEFKITSL